jgi:hypothetical protein
MSDGVLEGLMTGVSRIVTDHPAAGSTNDGCPRSRDACDCGDQCDDERNPSNHGFLLGVHLIERSRF